MKRIYTFSLFIGLVLALNGLDTQLPLDEKNDLIKLGNEEMRYYMLTWPERIENDQLIDIKQVPYAIVKRAIELVKEIVREEWLPGTNWSTNLIAAKDVPSRIPIYPRPGAFPADIVLMNYSISNRYFWVMNPAWNALFIRVEWEEENNISREQIADLLKLYFKLPDKVIAVDRFVTAGILTNYYDFCLGMLEGYRINVFIDRHILYLECWKCSDNPQAQAGYGDRF